MASLRVRVSWAPNGYLRDQSFPKQPIFCKPQQEIITSSRRRLSVAAAKLACRGGSTNTTSNNNSSAGLIDLLTKKKKTDSVEDDQYSNKLDQWMTDSVVEVSFAYKIRFMNLNRSISFIRIFLAVNGKIWELFFIFFFLTGVVKFVFFFLTNGN